MNNHIQIVSAREFRSNQGKFLSAAVRGQDVLLTSRYGFFRITSVSSGDVEQASSGRPSDATSCPTDDTATRRARTPRRAARPKLT